MSAESHYIPFKNSKIHYTLAGKGGEWLFCFHGYGENAALFGFLENSLEKDFTLVAIDFPFHGKTEWKEGLLFEPGLLVQLIQQIKPAHAKLSILGYSMGGRVALQLVQLIPESINKLLLIAPDGLHSNQWQLFATQSSIGNYFFKRVMHNPALLLHTMDALGKIGLYDQRLLKFVHFYLDDATERKRLYQRWTTLRQFSVHQPLLQKLIAVHQIPLTLVFGKHDRVILSKHGWKFQQSAPGLIKVIEIEAGHQLLKEKQLPLIISLLRQP
ncbi:MAG: hypothetical protein RLZZ28_1178 [Bacteroidota bacterium]